MGWGQYMISIARHHGELGKPRPMRVGKRKQGARKYPDEMVALIKLELQTNAAADVAAFHDVSYHWILRIADGTIRADVKPLELETA